MCGSRTAAALRASCEFGRREPLFDQRTPRSVESRAGLQAVTICPLQDHTIDERRAEVDRLRRPPRAGDLYVFCSDAANSLRVKARALGEGFAILERWLGDFDALFLRRDRADPLVVLPRRRWARLLSGMARLDGSTARAAGLSGLLADVDEVPPARVYTFVDVNELRV
jgi:hypothetical protein